MDEDNSEATVQIIKKGSWLTKKRIAILATSTGLIFFVILMIIMNYFDIISSFQLAFLPKKTTNLSNIPVKITLISENYGLKAGELTLDCPVESTFCKSQKLINLQNIDAVTYNNGVVASDAVAYKAASGSAVLNINKIPDLENIAVLTNQSEGKKYFYESVVSKDGKSCYTIAYTLPDDTTFQNILNLEILNNRGAIAKLGSETFKIANEEANVLIQVRNTPIDPGVPCSLIKKSPEFFQTF